MTWAETSPGHWVDELDGAEKVFYNLSQAFRHLGKEYTAVYCICKLQFEGKNNANLNAALGEREKLLYNAWSALGADYPGLRVVIAQDKDGQPRKEYRASASAKRIDGWASETFIVDDTGRPASEIVPTLALRDLPCLVYLPGSSEIIFHSQHWRIDALGTCMVLDRLFELVGSSTNAPQNGEKTEYQAVAQPRRRILLPSEYRRHARPGSNRSHSWETEPTFLLALPSLQFTAKSTEALVAACKKQGISVTAAVHAASAEVVFAQADGVGKEFDYSTIVAVNARDYLPAPYNTKPYAVAAYVTGLAQTARRGDNFAARSKHLTAAYRGSWGCEPKEYMAALRAIHKGVGERQSPSPSPGPGPGPSKTSHDRARVGNEAEYCGITTGVNDNIDGT
ncbi:uncharacterized protein DSM5745_01262 [Aspergillus mulundensis]|uniref:Uncharacterized protein n=1 Tax=Aspergillus mulundensis TaxID=1810919 RepID=A0A3D8T5Y3_9EURO|nr:hypothetical protein DSM5745_01262 [Aspergillus mulundensis]RDW93940.1 hypothetical protein DSM5745_01262 [Aspergillus mulundensis]